MKILSQNMWLLPAFFSVNNNTRRNQLLKHIRKSDYDVILLQEVWQRHDVEYLRWQLEDEYFVTCSNEGMFNFGGLVTLTKVKPHYAIFEQFEVTEEHNFEERYAAKGILTTRIKYSDKSIDVVNTHLYSPKNSEDEKVILSIQLAQVAEVVSRTEKVLLGGDFNIDISSKETVFHELSRDMQDQKPSVTKENIFQTMRLNRFNQNEFRIDFILVKNLGTEPISSRLLKEPLLSDHYGVVAEITV